MERAAEELSRGVEDAMIALFTLQTALINHFPGKYSTGLIDAFQSLRDTFRANWEKYIEFFQSCHGYAEDYILLCQYSETRNTAMIKTSAKNLLSMAKNISRELRTLKENHQKTLCDLMKLTKELPLEFQKQISLTGAYYGHSLEHYSHLIVIAAPPSTRISFPYFVQMAGASIRADGAQAMHALNGALNVIGNSLRHLGIFWTDQMDQLIVGRKPVLTFRLMTKDLSRHAETWRRYQCIPQEAISSISRSSDAIQVEPVGAPRRLTETKDSVKAHSFWNRLFDFFFRRRT